MSGETLEEEYKVMLTCRNFLLASEILIVQYRQMFKHVLAEEKKWPSFCRDIFG